MPSNSVTIYPFSNIYIGDYGVSTALAAITDLRTAGASISEEMPTQFVVSRGKKLQSGNHKVTVSLIFYANSDTVVKLARGLTLTSAASGIGTNQYTLFLLAPDETSKNSYYFPRLDTERVFDVRYGKDAATTIGVTFSYEARAMTDAIIYKDTAATLDTLMGIRSPI